MCGHLTLNLSPPSLSPLQVDVDPAHPKYIVTQGPLQNTVADFWQASEQLYHVKDSLIIHHATLNKLGMALGTRLCLQLASLNLLYLTK